MGKAQNFLTAPRTTREHWTQHITFAAETNATRVQSRIGGQTHTQTHTHRQTPSTTKSPLAKQRGEGKNRKTNLAGAFCQKNRNCADITTTSRYKICYYFVGSTLIFKPPPPVGAGGGYMFSGRPSVPLSVRPCVRPSVRPSVIHVVVLCFRDISSICWRIFAKLLSLVHLATEMNWLHFGVKRSKFKVTPSRRRRTALDDTVECNFF